MPVQSLKEILFLISSLLLNPFLPSFGLQTAISIAVGMVLPQKIVDPINHVLHRIPLISNVVDKFEEKLKKKKRLRTTIPRIIAGYLFTSMIGGIVLLMASII